jgi:hypothetical protein
MSPIIRLALAALLVLAAAPAAMAQCIVNPNAIGAPCVGNGLPAITNRSGPPSLQQLVPLPQPNPIPRDLPPVAQPRQAESLSRKVPSYPALPLPSNGMAQRCVTFTGSCPILGGAIPSSSCSCGSATGSAR